MKYKMIVDITDPNTEKGMTSNIHYEFDCIFCYDEETYGNGHYVSIIGKEFYKNYFDLRYDKTFDRNNKMKWLLNWATNYWSGKDGAWKLKSINLSKID